MEVTFYEAFCQDIYFHSRFFFVLSRHITNTGINKRSERFVSFHVQRVDGIEKVLQSRLPHATGRQLSIQSN